jgi:hypothetical protein
MKNLKIYIPALFASVFFVSCEQDAINVELPETSPKLVVGSFISPEDSAVAVTVSESNPIFGSNHNNGNTMTLPEAVVKLSDGVNTVTLPYDDLAQEFRISTALFPVVAGRTYSVEVSAPNVKSLPVSSSCTVPGSSVTSASAEVEPGPEGDVMEINWPDPSGQKNYYRVFVEYIMTNDNGDTTYYPENNRLYNDDGNDGGTMTSRINVYYKIGDDFIDWGMGMGDTSKVVAYSIIILNTEANYYKYIRSLDNYTYNNPFAEPSPLFTNIKDGLGVFAGYNSYRFRKF